MIQQILGRGSRLVIVLGLVLHGCRSESSPVFLMGDVEFQTPVGSGEPNLSVGQDGLVLLSWFEPVVDGQALKVATRSAAGWSEAKTIAASRSFFVNWADFPSVIETGGGAWVVHWLEKVEASPYAYHVMLARSTDRGETWSAPIRAHEDVSPTEHGFVSMLPLADDGTALVWLDGRNTGGGHEGSARGAMTLRSTTLSADGQLGAERLLDDRICDCCQTAAVSAAEGIVVAYRDRSEDEVRDIAITRFVSGEWTAPYHVGNDGWVYPACPVNGPSLSADGRVVVIAWFTGVNDRPTVYVAFSADAGASFGEPIQVDDGSPLGRVDIELLEDGSALVVWLERNGEEGRILARRVGGDGPLADPYLVTTTSPVRQSGFPRMVRVGDELVFAWNDVSETGGVRVATATLE